MRHLLPVLPVILLAAACGAVGDENSVVISQARSDLAALEAAAKWCAKYGKTPRLQTIREGGAQTALSGYVRHSQHTFVCVANGGAKTEAFQVPSMPAPAT